MAQPPTPRELELEQKLKQRDDELKKLRKDPGGRLNKFFRFNLPVMAYVDVLMQRMIAAASHTGDVIVVISYTGRTRELVEVAKVARDSGALVIGITRDGSPLAEVCTDILPVDLPEDTEVVWHRAADLASSLPVGDGEVLFPEAPMRLTSFSVSCREIKYAVPDWRRLLAADSIIFLSKSMEILARFSSLRPIKNGNRPGTTSISTSPIRG